MDPNNLHRNKEASDVLALIAEQDSLICVVDALGMVEYGNTSFWTLTGVTPSEGIGKPLVDLMVEALDSNVPPSLPPLLARVGATRDLEYGAVRLRGATGATRTFDVTLTPAPDEHTMVVAHDVTERDETIAALSDNQVLLESVMDSTAEAIIAMDMHGRITTTNASAREHFAQFAPNAWDEPILRARDDRGREIPQRDLPLGRALRGEVVTAARLVIDSIEGPIEFVASARPLLNQFRQQIGAVSVWADVTELRTISSTLSHTERFLEAILNATGDGIVALSFETGARFTNRLAEEWRLEQMAPLEVVFEASRSSREDQMFGSGLELRIPTEEGERDVIASAFLIPGEGDRPVGAVEVGRDVTDLKDKMRQLEVITTAFNSTVAAIAVTSPSGEIEWTNAAFSAMSGYPSVLAAGQPLSILDTDGQSTDWEEICRAASAEGSWEGRLEIQGLNRRPITTELTMSSVKDSSGEVANLIAIVEDVTEQLRADERIHYLATHDDLTGLANRRILRELLDYALARARRTGDLVHLFFLDLDRFKNINDTFGHPAGDQLIRKAGSRFKALVREVDVVARLGGDEFALMTEGTTAEDAGRLAERILEAMRQPFTLMGTEVQVSTSIGITASVGEKAPDELIEEADVALYQAKAIGRNAAVWFNEELGWQLKADLQIAQELREAITSNQFMLHYQPQYDLTTGQLIGVEALIRWEHKDRGMIPPGLFIGIAEDHGLMRPIGRWVRAEAFAQAKRWDDAGLRVPLIAVNLSPMELQDPTFADTILAEFDSCPIELDRIELELTEAALLSADPGNTDVLASLRSRGIRLSIDDFGTGYSSLLYLKQFRVNRIKVAQEFVKDLLNSPTSASIVEATIRLAGGLGLEVIAEGIEEREHVEFLTGLGCNAGQGYFMARPMPAIDVPHHMVAAGLTGSTSRVGAD